MYLKTRSMVNLQTHSKQATPPLLWSLTLNFKEQVDEQATLFFMGPFGNASEFKAPKDISALFAK
jgi:extradiol dioxygenase family protein